MKLFLNLFDTTFGNCKNLKSVKIPESVKKIGCSAFFTDGNSFTVIGYKDSAAQVYAKKEGFKFKDIETCETIDYKKANLLKIKVLSGKLRLKLNNFYRTVQERAVLFFIGIIY